MLTADWLQVVYMIGAAVVGWLVRHSLGSPTSSTLPKINMPGLPGHPILSFLQQLTQSRQQSDEILTLLRQFVNGDGKTPSAPSAPGGTTTTH